MNITSVRFSFVCLAIAVTALVATIAPRSHAACSMPVETSYASTIGGIDSPFLLPSQPRKITGPTAFAATDAVSIVYLPPSGPASLLVVRADCSTFDPTACAATPPSLPTIYCATVAPAVGTGPDSITFTMPAYAGEEGSGTATPITPAQADMVYRTGPARLIVSSSTTPPCKYADPAVACPATPDPDMKACIDTLQPATPAPPPPYQPKPYETITTVTGLPATNDFSLLCDTSVGDNRCKGTATELRLAIDSNGSILIPMLWTNVLRAAPGDPSNCPPNAKHCDKREVVAWTNLKAWDNPASGPINFPFHAPKVTQSFSLSGRTWGPEDPLFEIDNPANSDEFRVGGTADKHASVLRILRCMGGDQACSSANPAKFDVANRMEKQVGPVKVPKTKKCDNQNKDCQTNADCAPGSCISHGVGGQALGWVPVPPAPPPMPNPQSSGESWPYWLLLLAALGLVWWWYKKP